MNMKHWELHGSLPPKDGGKWRRNANFHVIASNAQRALSLVLRREPEFECYTLAHRGEVNIIEEKEDDFMHEATGSG